MTKMVGALGVPALILGFLIAAGCGGGGGPGPDPDADADDAPADVTADGVDAADVPEDPSMDGEEDVEEDVVEDVVDDEVVSHATGRPFSVETAGGAHMSDSTFILDLYIGPARPIGRVSGGSYQLQLGPAGLRGN